MLITIGMLSWVSMLLVILLINKLASRGPQTTDHNKSNTAYEIFKEMDEDEDGKIDKEELRKLMDKMNMDTSGNTVDIVWNSMDRWVAARSVNAMKRQCARIHVAYGTITIIFVSNFFQGSRWRRGF